MTDASQFPRLIRRAFEPGERGVAGLVDDLLGSCGERGLRLDWQDDLCRVHLLGVEPNDVADIPLGKSVFRAMLARIAALCNERVPDSVSAYGGEGELSIPTDRLAVFHVEFANTPGEQWMEVARVSDGDNGSALDGASEGVGHQGRRPASAPGAA
jgi:hypothetical protein